MSLGDLVLSGLRNVTTERTVFEIGTGQPFNLMIDSMNILLIACSLISNIRNQSYMYLLIFGMLCGTRTDRVVGLRNCGQLPTIGRFVDGPRQSEL